MANFKELSRYRNAVSTKNRNNEEFLLLRGQLELESANGDTIITITKDLLKRADLISFKAYGTPELWWVICDFNGIRDPLFDLKEGQQLRIPELERVLRAIDDLRR